MTINCSEGDVLEVVLGSHIFTKSQDGEQYLEWDQLPEEIQNQFTELKQSISGLAAKGIQKVGSLTIE